MSIYSRRSSRPSSLSQSVGCSLPAFESRSMRSACTVDLSGSLRWKSPGRQKEGSSSGGPELMGRPERKAEQLLISMYC